ncbi:hypothetical protein BGZ49_008255 [Haplosporangium sp. Z 27]|nr:hypothetical protein BGZ49_008255 [Haplosporangium sp. Z 27]
MHFIATVPKSDAVNKDRYKFKVLLQAVSNVSNYKKDTMYPASEVKTTIPVKFQANIKDSSPADTTKVLSSSVIGTKAAELSVIGTKAAESSVIGIKAAEPPVIGIKAAESSAIDTKVPNSSLNSIPRSSSESSSPSLHNDHRECIPMHIFSDLLSSEATGVDFVDDSFDVQFFHCDQFRHVNVIGAHQRILKEFYKLDLFVKKTEAARDTLAVDMDFLAFNSHHYPSPAPITVDISYMPLSAFRAILTFIYTRSIDVIFSNVSAIAVTSSSMTPEYNLSPSVVAEDPNGLTILYLDQVLYLAQRFEIDALVEVFERLTLASMTTKNAIQILVHDAEFKAIRDEAIIFIVSHYDQCIGRYRELNEAFEGFKDSLLCDDLILAITQAKIHRDLVVEA